jgi:Arylesterase
MTKTLNPRPRGDRFTRLVMTTVIQALLSIGLFSFVSSVTPGICRTIPLPGPGDLAYDYKSRTLFIAARDGLFALPNSAAKPLKIVGPPAGFQPTALSIGYDVGGAPALQVVGRTPAGRTATESYAVTFDGTNAPRLVSENLIQGGLIARAQGIASMGNGRFYVAADPTRSDLMAWADRYLLRSRATVLFFNGTLFRSAIEGLSDPTAVAVTPDGKHLFVASRTERRILAFTLEPFSGKMQENGSLSLPMRPERMMVDASGTVWVAGAPRLPAIAGGKNAPSQVVRVTVDAAGRPQSQETVFADDGKLIGAASSVVHTDGHLFIGSMLDDKLLDCSYK